MIQVSCVSFVVVTAMGPSFVRDCTVPVALSNKRLNRTRNQDASYPQRL